VTDLIKLATDLSGLGADFLWVGFLVFLRVGAAMALMPAFGEQAVPQRIKLVLALAFTAVVAPAVAADLPVLAPGATTPLVTEVIAGLIIGAGLRFFIIALQIAGTIIAQATTLSQLFAGTGPEPQPAISNLLVMAGLALAVMAGLHVHVVQLLILSYEPLPAGQFPGASDTADWGLFQVTQAFSLAFALAAPFVAASFIYNVAIGVINRAMPSLMVSFIGAPALALGGLLLLAVVTPVALAVWMTAMETYRTDPFAVTR
jgi:flagellar biosynthesis protein FliR